MWFFIPGLIILFIGILGLIVVDREAKPGAGAIAFLGAVLILLSCFASVGPRSVGVEKFFSATTGKTYGPGVVFKAPWNSVTDVDGSIHPEEYKGDNCIYVKIADAGTACVTLSYRWRIKPDGADEVYKDYDKAEGDLDDTVRTALVSTNIKASVNEVFGTYDPLGGVEITEDMTPEELASIKVQLPNLAMFNSAIEENVAEKIEDLGNLIEIQSVTVSYIKLPDTTQDRINQINAKGLDGKLALQDVAIKEAQAAANLKLAESLKDPNVLVSKCLDGLISGEIKAPAGFQCWSGNGGAVVVPSAN